MANWRPNTAPIASPMEWLKKKIHVGAMAWRRWPSVFQDSIKNRAPRWRMKSPIGFGNFLATLCHRPPPPEHSSQPATAAVVFVAAITILVPLAVAIAAVVRRFYLIVVCCMCPPPSLSPPPPPPPPLLLLLLLSSSLPSPSTLQSMPWEEEEVLMGLALSCATHRASGGCPNPNLQKSEFGGNI